MRRNSDHLRVKTLTHFGAPVVYLHTAIGINMNQGARLIEKASRKRDAEFNRLIANASLHPWALGIKILNLAETLFVRGRRKKLFCDLRKPVFFDDLPIMCDGCFCPSP